MSFGSLVRIVNDYNGESEEIAHKKHKVIQFQHKS